MKNNNYVAACVENWSARMDGADEADLRWHQVVQCLSVDEQVSDVDKQVSLLGFACDEGVRRNQGRVGAYHGPQAIRRVLASLPVHFNALAVLDRGDVYCDDGELEKAQDLLAEVVARLIEQKSLPIVLGGGHEVTFGHFMGLQKSLSGSIGIINIDAHFDLREPIAKEPTSGTGFYQIHAAHQMQGKSFHYLALGIQQVSNTRRLFDRAHNWNVSYRLREDFDDIANIPLINDQIKSFAKQVDHVYLTVDMDAFAAPYAPGVSALAFNGLVPDSNFLSCFDTIVQLDNLISVDFAELNPKYDIDQRTAKLAADLIFRLVNRISNT